MRDRTTYPQFRLLCTLLLTAMAGCATESHRAVQTEHTASSATPYHGDRNSIAVGKFDNRSTYLRGLFSDGVDRLGGQASVLLLLAGCQTVEPYDYTNFRAHPPRSMLVLPPLNESTAIEGTYGYLTTVTRPVAERGYYVFPVAVVDQFMKENGLPGAAEMQQAPLAKVAEITGADAVLFLDLKQYGAQYKVLSSVVTVEVDAKLVDTRTGTLLWQATA